MYRDREFGPTGFTGVEPLRPIRSADVEIIDAVALTVLASGATDDVGAFSILVSDNQTRDIEIRVLARGAGTPGLYLEVTNAAFVPYAIVSPTVNAHLPNADLDIGTLVAEIGQGGEPFNCWDAGLLGTDFVAFLDGSRPGSGDSLRIVWEASRGQPASTASFSRIDVRDTGAYDDTVILHEYGHFIVFNYSDSDNPGGPHGFAQCDQNPKLSWEEGHATFFGCAARKHHGVATPNIYVRTTGAAGPGHVSLYADLETETEYECDGDTSEVSIFTALWDVFDGPGDLDFTPGVDDTSIDLLDLDLVEHWETMTEGLPGRKRITSEDYWDAWFESPVQNGYLTEMITIFGEGVGIEHFEDSFEPNDTRASAMAVIPDGTLAHATFFTDPDGDGSGEDDRDVDWFWFDAVGGRTYHIETINLWSVADTKITVRDDGGPALASNDDREPGDASSFVEWVAPADGTYFVEVVQPNDFTYYGSFDLSVAAPDIDGDGIPNAEDPCPADAGNDIDVDGFCGDVDSCPSIFNPTQTDTDLDDEGDHCDLDDGTIHLILPDATTVQWQPEIGFTDWNLYRGDLAVLRGGGAYTQDPLGVPLATKLCLTNVESIVDADPIPSGQSVFFLVTGVSGSSEGDLGTDSLGMLRPNDNACP